MNLTMRLIRSTFFGLEGGARSFRLKNGFFGFLVGGLDVRFVNNSHLVTDKFFKSEHA